MNRLNICGVKLSLSVLFLALLIIGGKASAASMDFTFADGSITEYGKSKKEVIDVAIRIADPSLAGKKLTALTAYINTTEDLSDVSLWLSKELTLKSNINQPDLASYSVTPSEVTVQGRKMGLLYIELDNPYTLTEEPIYVGYTMSVDNLSTDEQMQPVIISGESNPEGCFMHMSKSVLKWMDYSRQANGSAYIVATIEGDFPQNAMSINGYTFANASENEGFSMNFEVKNVGTEVIKSIKYQYGENGELKEANHEFNDILTPNLALSFPLTLNFEGVKGIGTHPFYLNIIEVNGKKNEGAMPSLNFDLNVYPFIPVNRVLVEEYTGLWCGWCPRGYIAMEIIADEFADKAVPVCFHNGDDMTVTEIFPMDVSGYPKGSINRIAELDPYYGNYPEKDFGISYDIENLSSQLAKGEIDVNASLEGTIVKVTSTSRFIEDIPTADYEIGYILTCNGLSKSTWRQVNDYSGQTGYENSRLVELSTWGSSVFGLVFNDVAVDVDGMFGVAGSLPNQIEMSKEYVHTHNFDISGNELVENPENLNVVAYIIDRQTDKILNSNIYRFTSLAAVNTIQDLSTASKTFYDLSGRIIENPGKGLYILMEKMSDGNYRTSKVMVP